MAEDFEHNIRITGLNQLGAYNTKLVQVKANTASMKTGAMNLHQILGKHKVVYKELNGLMVGNAQSMRHIIRNQKMMRSVRKMEIQDLQKSQAMFKKGTQEYKKMGKEVRNLRNRLRTLPLRKLGTDLRNVSKVAQGAAKNLQWVGRQMMVGFGMPVIMVMRKAIQQFYSFEKALVRTQKILAKNSESMEETRQGIAKISKEVGASQTLVAGLTADFAQMGITLLGSIKGSINLEKVALQYTRLALDLEKVGQVQAGVGRDFIANLSGLTQAMGHTGDRIEVVSGLLAKFNMLENTTALSMADLAEAFPQVSPAAVAAGIDLVFLTGMLGRMKEMGLNATESAHALKFSIQRLVNPTTKAAKAAKKYSDQFGPEFHENLGMGNMMIFNLAENMKLLAERASDKEALVYLGELVGKRQASRLFALVMGMEGLTGSIQNIGQAFQDVSLNASGAMSIIGRDIDSAKSLENVEQIIKHAFNATDKIRAMEDDIIRADMALGDLGMGLRFDDTETDQNERSSAAAIWNKGLSGMSPELKALIIDYMGATAAGKIFTDELAIVMAGPAAMMDKMKADVRDVMIDFGAVFYGTLQGLLPVIRDFTEKIKGMSENTKKGILILVGGLVALGPFIFAIAQIGIVFATVGRALAFLTPSMKMLNTQMMISRIAQGKSLGRMRNIAGMWIQEDGLIKRVTTSLKMNNATRLRGFKALKSAAGMSSATGAGAAAASGTATWAGSGAKAAAAATGPGGIAGFNAAMSGMMGPGGQMPDIIPPKSTAPPKGMKGMWTKAYAHVTREGTKAAAVKTRAQRVAATRAGKAWTSSFKMAMRVNTVIGVAAAQAIGGAFKAAGRVAKMAFKFGGFMLILTVIVGLVMMIKDNLGKFGEALKPGIEIFKQIFAQLMSFLSVIGNTVMEIFGQVFGGGGEGGEGGAEGGIASVGKIFEKVATFVQQFLNVVQNVILKILPPILKFFFTIVKAVFTAIVGAIRWVISSWETIADVVQSVIFWIVKLVESWVDAQIWVGKQIINAIRYLVRGFFWLVQMVGKVMDMIVDALGMGINAWITYARTVINIVLSLVEGVLSAVEKIADGISFLGNMLGIENNLGDWDITSWVDGVRDGLDTVEASARSFINNWTDDATSFEEGAVRMGNTVDSVFGGIVGLLDTIMDYDAARNISELIGGALGNVSIGNMATEVSDAVADGIDDGEERGFKDLNEEQKSDMADAVEDAVGKGFQKAINDFIGKVKDALKDELAKIADAAMQAFDAYTEVALSAYDARIEAINEVKEAEKELTKTLEYEANRREMLNQMAVDKENYLRNRHLAIYEGRIEDARNLTVQRKIQEEQSSNDLEQLDESRSQFLLNKERDLAIEAINVAKELEKERLDIIREGFAEHLAIFKENLPATVEQWQGWMDGLKDVTDESFQTAFGDSGVLESSLEGVSESIQNSINDWDTIVDSFDPVSKFQEIFDRINAEWKKALQWEIIAQSWMDEYMDVTIPLLLEALKEIRGEMEDAAGSAGASAVESAIDAADQVMRNWYGEVADTADAALLNWTQGWQQSHPVYDKEKDDNPENPDWNISPGELARQSMLGNISTPNVVNEVVGPTYHPQQQNFFGGAVKAQYGRYLNGFKSAAVPVIAHGGEYIMNARSVQDIGLSNLEAMNRTGKGYSGGGGAGVTINVDNFIGQPEWFEEMMQEYDVKVSPRADRNAGTDVRKISSMSDASSRRRV